MNPSSCLSGNTVCKKPAERKTRIMWVKEKGDSSLQRARVWAVGLAPYKSFMYIVYQNLCHRYIVPHSVFIILQMQDIGTLRVKTIIFRKEEEEKNMTCLASTAL